MTLLTTSFGVQRSDGFDLGHFGTLGHFEKHTKVLTVAYAFAQSHTTSATVSAQASQCCKAAGIKAQADWLWSGRVAVV